MSGGRKQAPSAQALLRELEALRLRFDGDAAARKRRLLAAIRRARMAGADELLRLHELLLFWRAYPDDEELLAEVEALLAGFDSRPELRRHRRELAGSGVAGCDIDFPFFYATAVRLAERFPSRLEIDWPAWEDRRDLEPLLHLLVTYSETPAVDEMVLTPRQWIEQLRGPHEAGGAFLARRFAALAGDSFVRETLYDRLSPALVLRGGPETPSRTQAKAPVRRIHFQSDPLGRGRPDLRRFLAGARVHVRPLDRREGARYLELARDAMVTRSRDLDAFANGDANDVRLVECDDGLAFALLGQVPERRLMLEAVYGALTLHNGVPIGYVLLSSLFGSTEIAYNVFDTYRGAEAAHVFAWVVAAARAVFGTRTFSIDPYQLGHFGNHEGLASGAWWFYYKLGFRPRDRAVQRVVRDELAAMRRDPGHRSTMATLERLSAEPLFLDLDGDGGGVALGGLSPGQLGARLSRQLAERHGADRERALAECEREAAEQLGVRSRSGWSASERLWWRRWSPLVRALPSLSRWSRAERRALVDVVRAKGGRRESDYVRRFDAHRKLRRTVLEIVTPE